MMDVDILFDPIPDISLLRSARVELSLRRNKNR